LSGGGRESAGQRTAQRASPYHPLKHPFFRPCVSREKTKPVFNPKSSHILVCHLLQSLQKQINMLLFFQSIVAIHETAYWFFRVFFEASSKMPDDCSSGTYN